MTPPLNLRIIVDRVDVNTYCRLYVNHEFAGKLCIQTHLFDDFSQLITASNGTIETAYKFTYKQLKSLR